MINGGVETFFKAVTSETVRSRDQDSRVPTLRHYDLNVMIYYDATINYECIECTLIRIFSRYQLT